jgi:hypothetical protein
VASDLSGGTEKGEEREMPNAISFIVGKFVSLHCHFIPLHESPPICLNNNVKLVYRSVKNLGLLCHALSIVLFIVALLFIHFLLMLEEENCEEKIPFYLQRKKSTFVHLVSLDNNLN